LLSSANQKALLALQLFWISKWNKYHIQCWGPPNLVPTDPSYCEKKVKSLRMQMTTHPWRQTQSDGNILHGLWSMW